MAASGTTQSVAAGLATAPVVATLPATYQVAISTSWITSWDVAGKSATGFTVNFAVPAPAGGGTFDWVATAGTSATLASGSTAVGAGLGTITVPAGSFSN